MAAIRDKDVELKSNCLEEKSVLFGICGGIAATESVKIARELRRHGAKLTVMMTESAQKIISPLAIEWASDTKVKTNWDSEMSQLDDFDSVLIAPATRNFLANLQHGVMSSPLLMALSAARGRGVPIVLVPSMHSDLFDDPITSKLENELISGGCDFIWGLHEEGKKKQRNPISLVAEFSHIVNERFHNPKNIVVTLGSTKSKIDDVRFVQNTSSGKTGWGIACDLYRRGHDITVVSGVTTAPPEFRLPLVIYSPEPEEMLLELIALSKCDIDVWIHCAAVLDYIPLKKHAGKIPSGDEKITVEFGKTMKHIDELIELTKGSVRIGFKLETRSSYEELIRKSKEQLNRSKMSAVIANNLEGLKQNSVRGYLVEPNEKITQLSTSKELEAVIRKLIED